MIEQPQGYPGIFGRDKIHLGKGLSRPWGQVPQIADRGGHHIKGAASGLLFAQSLSPPLRASPRLLLSAAGGAPL